MDLNLYALELLARDKLARARAEAALHARVARHATPRDGLDRRALTVRDAAEADLAQITAIWNHEVLWTDATTDTEPRNARAEREWFERNPDRKSTRLNSSHTVISYAVFCLKKKKKNE